MNARGTFTLFKKETWRFGEVWTQTVIAPVITNVLFMVIFGVALSTRTSSIPGFEYLQILIPGLVAMSIMMNAYQNPMSSLIISKYTNVISDILRIPLNGFEITIAYVAAGMLRGVLVGLVTLIVGMFFVNVPFAHPLLIVLFSLLLSGTFSAFGVIVGVTMPSFDKASMIQTFLLTPLSYLGGVFFSVATLPGAASTVARFNPLLYMVDGFRYGFVGAGDAPIWLSIVVTFVIFALCFVIASWIFHTGYKLKT